MSRSSRWSIRLTQAFLVLGCLISVYLLSNFYVKSVESYWLEQREAGIRREIVRLEYDNHVLETQVARAQTNEYVEVIAREQLNLVRPGDHPLIILREGEAATPVPLRLPAALSLPTPVAAESPSFAEFGHLSEWLTLFFGPP